MVLKEKFLCKSLGKFSFQQPFIRCCLKYSQVTERPPAGLEVQRLHAVLEVLSGLAVRTYLTGRKVKFDSNWRQIQTHRNMQCVVFCVTEQEISVLFKLCFVQVAF